MGSRGGRPVGSKDKKKSSKKKRSLANIRREAAKEVVKEVGEIPPITVHPRVGDDVDMYGPADKKIEALIGAPKAKPKREPTPAKETKPKVEPPKEERAQFELKLIGDFLKMPFAIWAKRIQYPPIRLTETEAKEWAEPTKVLLDHYMPLIPPIAYAWIAWGIIATNVVDKRLELIAAEKERRQAAPSAEKGDTPAAQQPASEKQGAPAYKPKKV